MHALRQLICKCAWGDRNVPTQNCIYETNPGEDHTHLAGTGIPSLVTQIRRGAVHAHIYAQP